MKIAVLLINKDAEKSAEKLKSAFPNAVFIKVGKGRKDKSRSLNDIVEGIFSKYSGIVFFAACGIVARCIALFIKSKYSDPAVVCVDTKFAFRSRGRG
ncbi:hypothetical protein KAW08_02945 [bacterium]|nr:hypothetical protein [bacterium]